MKNLTEKQLNEIIEKANKWDALKTEMSDYFYDEENEEGLDVLGEMACSAFGFYG